jgi:hypothetical protein
MRKIEGVILESLGYKEMPEYLTVSPEGELVEFGLKLSEKEKKTLTIIDDSWESFFGIEGSVYMVYETDGIEEFDSLRTAREYVTETEPAIINYSVFYRAPAGLYISTEIAAKGQLLAYGYNIMNQ